VNKGLPHIAEICIYNTSLLFYRVILNFETFILSKIVYIYLTRILKTALYLNLRNTADIDKPLPENNPSGSVPGAWKVGTIP